MNFTIDYKISKDNVTAYIVTSGCSYVFSFCTDEYYIHGYCGHYFISVPSDTNITYEQLIDAYFTDEEVGNSIWKHD